MTGHVFELMYKVNSEIKSFILSYVIDGVNIVRVISQQTLLE